MTTSEYRYTHIAPGHLGRPTLMGITSTAGSLTHWHICEDNTYAWAVQPKVGDTLTVTRDEQGVPINIRVNGRFAWALTIVEHQTREAAARIWLRERTAYLQRETNDDPGIHRHLPPSTRFNAHHA